MTATLSARARAELAAIEVLVWGDPEATIDAYEAGTIRPEHFADPDRRTVAEVVVELIDAGVPPSPVGVHDRLLALGWSQEAATAAVLNRGGFEAANHRLDALDCRLAVLADEHDRHRLRVKLSALADTLDRPGGVERVAEVLEVVA